MNVIFGNYGNETLGLIQWVAQQQLEDVYVVSVETHWAAVNWHQQVVQAENIAKTKGFTVVRLQAKLGFAKLVEERQDFPTTQYQWCAGFLKGLAFLDWLDDVDCECKTMILLGNRRALSRGRGTLPEFIEESEHYGERRVWHPLYKCSDEELARLVAKTGMDVLSHRSLECDPCVNNTSADFLRLKSGDINKTKELEKNIEKQMFNKESYCNSRGVEQVIHWIKRHPQNSQIQPMDMGCGSPFACGL